jgi:hypothetical protein
MQEAMKNFTLINIGLSDTGPLRPGKSSPLSVSLTIKIALASGTARRYVVGDPDIQLMDVLAGETLYRLAGRHFAEKEKHPGCPPRTLGSVFAARSRDPETGQEYAVLSGLESHPKDIPAAGAEYRPRRSKQCAAAFTTPCAGVRTSSGRASPGNHLFSTYGTRLTTILRQQARRLCVGRKIW